MRVKISVILFISLFLSRFSYAQLQKVDIQPSTGEVKVLVGGQHFTSFLYPDTLEKPVLYPINAADGITVTRGFPLQTRNGERTDHPHHLGLWLNYESVNGLDFWNNSYAIPKEKKSHYGWIRNVKVAETRSGDKEGRLTYSANWENQSRKILLKEKTTFVFSGTADTRIIDRITTLTAEADTVFFKDIKDGMLGLRVTKELEIPSDRPEEFTDVHGNITKISPKQNGANGNYLTSEGKQGDDAWGTRGRWCVLSGTVGQKPVAVGIIDHPKNPGYPTYWHARGYGLFAANPLGQKIFSNGKEELNLTLKRGQTVTFKYRIIVRSGSKMSADDLNHQAGLFSKK